MLKKRKIHSHENYEQERAKRGSNKSFGTVFTIFFGIIMGITLWKNNPSWIYWMLASIITLSITILFPKILSPFNKVWYHFGILLSKFTNPIILGLLFFGAITPIGLILKAMGKDPLKLKFDSKLSTYWITRDPPGPEPRTMNRQF